MIEGMECKPKCKDTQFVESVVLGCRECIKKVNLSINSSQSNRIRAILLEEIIEE